MSAKPTGRFAHRDDGLYLLLDRLFAAPVEDVWWSLTHPSELEKWIGTYTGNPATGGVKFLMSAEPDAEWEYASILECRAPYRFSIDIGEGEDKWHVFCHLSEAGGMTTLTLGQRMKSPADASTMGPGWDYYLDRLIAARAGTALPQWEHYYPAHAEYYKDLVLPERTG
ncbi:SRPBCC domain-containing protein [Luethyella okanaganae]|uniref:SRPBCC domain-containing protein n=1 Tax=Luethyella okanaganae TaxID=69372 RepID=A0ABW1VGM0_9MICO